MAVQQGIINHVGIVLDKSSSMHSLTQETIKVADETVRHLAELSGSSVHDQETRATVYTFSDPQDIECVYYDKDVLRLPSIAGFYKPYGNTALIDATLKAIDDLSRTATLYGDHAFLLYVLTDGEENRSTNYPRVLQQKLQSLDDRWTVAALVPTQYAADKARNLGFSAGNISVWKTSKQGMVEVGRVIQQANENYMVARSQGIRSTKGLFDLDVSNLTKRNVSSVATKLSTDEYDTFPVTSDADIKKTVEALTRRPYRIHSTYYELTKSEEVQPQKDVIVREKSTGVVFKGARSLLNLPDYTVTVRPKEHPLYDIFIESTSHNRKLKAGQWIIVLRPQGLIYGNRSSNATKAAAYSV